MELCEDEVGHEKVAVMFFATLVFIWTDLVKFLIEAGQHTAQV